MMVLEPIFEAESATGTTCVPRWRECAGRGQAVHRLINTGHTAVVDADLRGYFDEIRTDH